MFAGRDFRLPDSSQAAAPPAPRWRAPRQAALVVVEGAAEDGVCAVDASLVDEPVQDSVKRRPLEVQLRAGGGGADRALRRTEKERTDNASPLPRPPRPRGLCLQGPRGPTRAFIPGAWDIPFSPVHSARKFSAERGAMALRGEVFRLRLRSASEDSDPLRARRAPRL